MVAGKPNFAAGLLLLGFFGGGLFRLGFGFAFFGGDNHLLDGALALSASENCVISGRERSLFTQANPHNTHDDSPIIVEKTPGIFPCLVAATPVEAPLSHGEQKPPRPFIWLTYELRHTLAGFWQARQEDPFFPNLASWR